MFPRIARVLLAAFCVLVVAQQSNIGSLLMGDECPQSCPDDVAPHRCPPNCTSCTCIGNGIPLSLAQGVPAVIAVVGTRIEIDAPTKLPDPLPSAIFHVPKSSLA